MKNPIIFLFVLVLSVPAFCQKKNKPLSPITIPLVAENWAFQEGKVEFTEYKSRPAIKILPQAGFVVLKDFDFSDGTIEFDMETLDPNFASFYFRWENEKENECFYLRTGNIGKPLAKEAVQYAPHVAGVNLWDIMEHYQTNATLRAGDWNHIKLVISGKQMRVYVNSAEPTLIVPHLEGNTTHGTLAFDSQSYVSNLVVKPGEVESLSPEASPDLTDNDPRYLRSWEVSPVTDAPKPLEMTYDFFPTPETGWERIEAERMGLVNLTRKFGKSESRRIVWIRTKIHSEKEQIRALAFGFSDEVWVLINGRMLYADKNFYGNPIMKSPGGRCTIENSNLRLPLKEGENELLVGVANDFYGWAIIARMDSMDGILKLE